MTRKKKKASIQPVEEPKLEETIVAIAEPEEETPTEPAYSGPPQYTIKSKELDVKITREDDQALHELKILVPKLAVGDSISVKRVN